MMTMDDFISGFHIRQWKAQDTDHGTTVVMDSNGETIVEFHGSPEQRLWLASAINAATGYTIEELRMVETLRDQHDRRVFEAGRQSSHHDER